MEKLRGGWAGEWEEACSGMQRPELWPCLRTLVVEVHATYYHKYGRVCTIPHLEYVSCH